MIARRIIAVDAVGVRAIAGPVTAAAVLYEDTAKEPTFVATDRRGRPVRYTLTEPAKIPDAMLAGVVAHIRRTALSVAQVQRPARVITNAKDAAWYAMGQAAARVTERVIHQNSATLQVRPDELEIYIPAGGHCPYALVGRVGQRPMIADWRRGAALILARAAHIDALNQLHDVFPEYDFATNRGNTSQTHLKAIRRYGHTPEHRGHS